MLNKIKKTLCPSVGVRERGIFRPRLVMFSPDQVVAIPHSLLKSDAVRVNMQKDGDLYKVSATSDNLSLFTFGNLTEGQAALLVKSFRNRVVGKWGIGRWALAIVVASFIISGGETGEIAPEAVAAAPAVYQPLASMQTPSYPEAIPSDAPPAEPIANSTFGLPETTFGD